MELNEISERILGSAIEVHRHLGPGLLEAVYEEALCIELSGNGLGFERQKALPVYYKKQLIGKQRLDLVVENRVVVELKAVKELEPLFQAQLLGYLKLGGYPLGLLINFNTNKQGH
jgi:GxxExxY protein